MPLITAGSKLVWEVGLFSCTANLNVDRKSSVLLMSQLVLHIMKRSVS
jgi:hypothetical protein